MGPTLMETQEVAPLLGLPWWDKQVIDRCDSDMMGIYKTGSRWGGWGGGSGSSAMWEGLVLSSTYLKDGKDLWFIIQGRSECKGPVATEGIDFRESCGLEGGL